MFGTILRNERAGVEWRGGGEAGGDGMILREYKRKGWTET